MCSLCASPGCGGVAGKRVGEKAPEAQDGLQGASREGRTNGQRALTQPSGLAPTLFGLLEREKGGRLIFSFRNIFSWASQPPRPHFGSPLSCSPLPVVPFCLVGNSSDEMHFPDWVGDPQLLESPSLSGLYTQVDGENYYPRPGKGGALLSGRRNPLQESCLPWRTFSL